MCYNERVREICMEKADKQYDGQIPQEVLERINWELDAIQNTECAKVFCDAMQLMKQLQLTAQDVGMRGHCGGSLITHLCGISSFNPVEYKISPYFTYGYHQNKFMGIDIYVPSELYIEALDVLRTIDPQYSYAGDGKRLSVHMNDNIQMLYNLRKRTGVKMENVSANGISNQMSHLSECVPPCIRTIMETVETKSCEDVIKVVCLAQDKGTWEGNAECLIHEGAATLESVISNRDDVFDFLTSVGMQSEMAYAIAESVRKGRGLKEEHICQMEEFGVPEWYIGSCQKIEYLYSRAHAVSYVLNILRLAYFRINYPKQFDEERAGKK